MTQTPKSVINDIILFMDLFMKDFFAYINQKHNCFCHNLWFHGMIHKTDNFVCEELLGSTHIREKLEEAFTNGQQNLYEVLDNAVIEYLSAIYPLSVSQGNFCACMKLYSSYQRFYELGEDNCEYMGKSVNERSLKNAMNDNAILEAKWILLFANN